MPVKIALPKGRLLKKTAALLQKANWNLDEYHSRISFYHPKTRRFPELVIKVFHEKDIPIQVAIGNYDLGICGQDWVQELTAKYPSSAVLKVRDLGYGCGALFMAASPSRKISLRETRARDGILRIASEYPNLAENFALQNRLARFRVFPVWGAAEGYPPENAELALVSGKSAVELADSGLIPVSRVLDYNAVLIANKTGWAEKDLGEIIASICDEVSVAEIPISTGRTSREIPADKATVKTALDDVRLALPDGHQQQPTLELLQKCGIRIGDYPSSTGNRRPEISLAGVRVKVIRPQDMPLQVANGNFDLAITGRDWLREHLNQFPSSPVKGLADLKFGGVRIVAVVSQELPVNDAPDLRRFNQNKKTPLRIASEYVHIADWYARENHLGYYRIIPTWGATEAFLPEDADLLIENTQTGRTISRHNLRIIDDIFESTACLIGSTRPTANRVKRERIKSLLNTIRSAVEGTK
ncbi:ATP phosphoribosyltransferase [Chloroflexota bacterium]